MATDTANVVIVVIILIIFLMLISACCRQLRAAYDEQVTTDELARRRQAFIISPGNDGDEVSQSVRVTAISPTGDHVLGVYEIRVPRHGRSGGARSFFSRSPPPPPPFHTALQNSSPIYYIDPEDPPPSYDDYLKTQEEGTSADTSTSIQHETADKNKY